MHMPLIIVHPRSAKQRSFDCACPTPTHFHGKYKGKSIFGTNKCPSIMHPRPTKRRPFNYAGAYLFWGGVYTHKNLDACLRPRGSTLCSGPALTLGMFLYLLGVPLMLKGKPPTLGGFSSARVHPTPGGTQRVLSARKTR